jgi:hypothetical protein
MRWRLDINDVRLLKIQPSDREAEHKNCDHYQPVPDVHDDHLWLVAPLIDVLVRRTLCERQE